MGVNGQLYIGAIAATYIAMKITSLTAPLAASVTLIFAMLAGGLFAVIPALMKIKLKCDEVVTTLLLNYVAYFFTDYVVLGPMRGPGALAMANSTDYIPENTWLPRINLISYPGVTTALYLALILTVIMAILIYKTKFGYEIKICGSNPRLAEYGGINSSRVIFLVMILSGMIAGAIGAVEVMGVQHRFQMRFSKDVGFDGVVVSLLAGNHPIGIFFTALFFGTLKNGAMTLQRIADVPGALVDIVRGIIIFTITLDFTVIQFRKKGRHPPQGQRPLFHRLMGALKALRRAKPEALRDSRSSDEAL
jgi:simple sugar transport system permease protein